MELNPCFLIEFKQFYTAVTERYRAQFCHEPLLLIKQENKRSKHEYKGL